MPAFVPLAAWYLWVDVRVGGWPFADPAASRRDALALPFTALHLARPAVLLIGAVTVVAAVLATRRTRWFPIVPGAVCLAALIPCYGPSVWALSGEALRVMVPAQVLLILAFVGRLDAAHDAARGSVPVSVGG